MATVYVYDPIYLEHNLPSHPESADRLQRILRVLEKEGMLSRLRRLAPRPATDEELLRVHSAGHIEHVRRAVAQGRRYLDPDTYITPRSLDAALMAAGGLVRAVEAMLGAVSGDGVGEVDNGFALVRPPGHHATPTRSMGFCIFNNVAVAARAALTFPSVERVFIADFDVHHGNGTQDIFAGDPAVFYFSTHQYPYYPGTGSWDDTGYGAGAGTVLNVPLPPQVGDSGFARIFAELVWPLAERFQPDLILVSAGYDAHWNDPLAQMNLSLAGYAHIAGELVAMARQLCRGHILFTLEGGYNLEVLAYGVLNTFAALVGEERVADPIGPTPYAERPIDDLLARLKRIHHLDE